MICPACGAANTRIKDVFEEDETATVRRKRACETCGKTATTVEMYLDHFSRCQPVSTGVNGLKPVSTGGNTGGLGGSVPVSGRSGSGSSGSVPDRIHSLLPDQGVDPARARKAKRAAEPTEFAAFWAVYPRKVARAKALATWIKIDPGSELIQLIQSAILGQRSGFLAREPDKVPHAATWLNGQRWNDAIESAGANGAATRSQRTLDAARRFLDRHEGDPT